MMTALPALLLPLVAAWVLLGATPLGVVVQRRPVLRVGLAVSVGLGLSALLTSWWLLFGAALDARFLLVDTLLWAAVIVMGWRASRAERPTPRASSPQLPAWHLTDLAARIAFVLVALMAVVAIVAQYRAYPLGQWDAWAIWNEKARFLIRGGDDWTGLLTVGFSNPSHPWLVSASVARLWAYAGAELTILPTLVGSVAGGAVVCVVMGALDVRRTRAFVAGAVLLAPAVFVHQFAMQQADIPLALFVVAALSMLLTEPSGEWTDTQRASALFLLGLLTGLAAWTKNEGLALLVAGGVSGWWFLARHGRYAQVGWWVAGAAPGVLTVLWFTQVVAQTPPPYLADTQTLGSVLSQILSPERHLIVAQHIGPLWIDWGGPWSAGALPVVMVSAIAAAAARPALRGPVAAVALLATAYYLVYLLSQLDIAVLVTDTFPRLTSQVWPMLVLAACALNEPSGTDTAPLR